MAGRNRNPSAANLERLPPVSRREVHLLGFGEVELSTLGTYVIYTVPSGFRCFPMLVFLRDFSDIPSVANVTFDVDGNAYGGSISLGVYAPDTNSFIRFQDDANNGIFPFSNPMKQANAGRDLSISVVINAESSFMTCIGEVHGILMPQ